MWWIMDVFFKKKIETRSIYQIDVVDSDRRGRSGGFVCQPVQCMGHPGGGRTQAGQDAAQFCRRSFGSSSLRSLWPVSLPAAAGLVRSAPIALVALRLHAGVRCLCQCRSASRHRPLGPHQ
jgi:hypothetical protein